MYNSELCIEKCLDSVLNQNIDEADVEILVMDDASTDSSVKFVKKYTQKYNNIILFPEEKMGVYAIRNKLLALAKGDYIYFIDSDDYLIKGALKIVLDLAIENKLEGIGFKTLVVHNQDDSSSEKYLGSNIVVPKIQDGLSIIAFDERMRHEIWWYILKRDFLNRHNISFQEFPYSMDVMFTIKVFNYLKKFMYLQDSIYRYSSGPNSITKNSNKIHQAKLIECQIKMISDLTLYINSIDLELPNYYFIKNNLIFRRDVYTFFVIARMIKAKLSVHKVKDYISLLKENDVYPLKHFIGKNYNTFKYKLLNFVFNKSWFLYTLMYFNRLLRKR